MSAGAPLPNPSARVYIVGAVIGGLAIIIAAWIGRSAGVSSGQQDAFATAAVIQATSVSQLQPTVSAAQAAVDTQQAAPTQTPYVIEVTSPPVTVIVTSPPIVVTSPPIMVTSVPTTLPTPNPSVLFSDTFEDNKNGWPLGESTRISQGKLAVTVNRSSPQWIALPNVKVVEGDFYLQAELTYVEGHGCSTLMGLAAGEAGGSQHRFMMFGGCGRSSSVSYYDNNKQLFETPYKETRLLINSQSYIVGLESLNGVFTLYIDGKATDSVPIKAYGGNIGFFLWRVNNGFTPTTSLYTIDNVVLRKTR